MKYIPFDPMASLRPKGHGKSNTLKRPYVTFHAMRLREQYAYGYSMGWKWKAPFHCQEYIDRIRARADELCIEINEISVDKVYVRSTEDAFLLYFALV